MKGFAPRCSAIVLLAAALGGCGGGDGPSITPLGTFDPDRNPFVQELDSQLIQGSGTWAITLDHKVQIDRGDGTPPVIVDSVLYDANNDVLTVTIDGAAFDLADLSPVDGTRESAGCRAGPPETCVTDTPVIARLYAQSDRIAITGDSVLDTEAFAVFGVRTAAADMPLSGTADYSGSSVYLVDLNGVPDDLNGAPTITVDFLSGSVEYTDSASGTASTLDIAASGTISGNGYSGTVTGTYDPDGAIGSGAPIGLVEAGSLFAGTFYGPAADSLSRDGSETAGVLAAGAGADATVIGTFGAGLDTFTP